jgi:hypothetical protein
MDQHRAAMLPAQIDGRVYQVGARGQVFSADLGLETQHSLKHQANGLSQISGFAARRRWHTNKYRWGAYRRKQVSF